MSRDSYYPFYGWLIIVGLIVFGGYLLWEFNLLQRLVSEDVTYLSSFILILFIFTTAYLGIAAWRLSKQILHTQQLATKTNPLSNNDESHNFWAEEHLLLLQWQREQSMNESESLLARLVEKVHRGHSSGWFLSETLMRLGLIGTVIGFVLMLSTVYQMKENDVQALQQLLSTMGSGMQVALFTTLTGLGTALLISVQSQWLDRCADRLIGQIIRLGMSDSNAHKSSIQETNSTH